MSAGIFANMVSLTNGGRHLIMPSLGPPPQKQCVSYELLQTNPAGAHRTGPGDPVSKSLA